MYLTTDDKRFLNKYKAIIHESELEEKRNKNRRWEQMKTDIAELVCEVLKDKQWGIFFKHEPVQALPVQNNTVLYKVNEVKEEELVSAVIGRPEKTNIVMTGRDAPPEFVEIADTVTEMHNVKHAYEKGIVAKRGIDY